MSVLTLKTARTVELTELEIAQARAFYNQNHPESPIKRGRTSNDVIIAWLEAGKPEVEIPVKATNTVKDLFTDKAEKNAFYAWARENNLSKTADAVADWEKAGKPAKATKAPTNDDDVVAEFVVRNLDKNGRPNGKAFNLPIVRSDMREVRGGAKGPAKLTDYFDAADLNGVRPTKLIVGNFEYEIDEDGNLVKSVNVGIKERLAKAETRVAELEAELAALKGE